MIPIKFNYTDYRKTLHYFAAVFRGRIKNNTLHLPSTIVDGFMKLIKLPSNVQAPIPGYTLKQDLFFKRTKINKNFYTLRSDEVIISDTAPSATLSKFPAAPKPTSGAVFLAVVNWTGSL